MGIDLGRYRVGEASPRENRIDMPVAAVSLVKFTLHGQMLQKLGDRTHLSAALQARAGT